MICHGFNSHSAYYTWAAERLSARDLAIFALDLRGRGRSEGERFYVERMSDYVRDIAAVVTLAKSRHAGLPVFLLGHSAGGVASCVYALEHQAELSGLICESLAFELPAPRLAIATLRALSHFAPHARVLRLKNELFSRDAVVVRAMNEDPLIARETQPTRTVAVLTSANDRLRSEFGRITLPLLFLHGTADNVTKPSGSIALHAAARSSDKTLQLLEGRYHDLLNDVGRADVLTSIQGWIEQRLPRATNVGH